MKYLLDTNICIYIINNRPKSVLDRFNALEVGDVAISVITLYELLYGAYKSQQVDKNTAAVRKFITPLELIKFNELTADACGKLRAEQEQTGNILGPMDLQIAATAIARSLTLVTNNTREFQRVNNLKLESWVD